MPNFIAKNLKNLEFPYEEDGFIFSKIAKNDNLSLIFVKKDNEDFFLALKERKDRFLIKSEKLTRPSKIATLQRALEIFENRFCKDIISKSFAFKKRLILQKDSVIKTQKDAVDIINKFDGKIFIEIGFGSGRHLLHQALNNKDALIVGIEIYKPSMQQVAKLAALKNLKNVVLVNYDARIFLETIKSNLIDKIFLHFPVPWDDSPHRRVVSSEFIKETLRVLKQDGRFELRTDSRNYAEYLLKKLFDLNRIEVKLFKNRELEVTSKYEDRWRKQSKDIFDIIVTNLEISKNIEIKFDMKFDFKINLDKFTDSFNNKTFKFDDFFVHFEDIFIVNKDEVLLKVSFGAFDRPESKYIVLNKDEIYYFKSHPLNTKSNIKACKFIKETLSKWRI